jgi:chorismate mutase
MNLKVIRQEIDKTDEKLLSLLDRRFQLAILAKVAKKKLKLPIEDSYREREIIKRMEKMAKNRGLPISFINKIFKLIINEAKRKQK